MTTRPEPEFEQYRELLDDLARAVPEPPDVHWGRYRAELRAKLATRRERRHAWWQRPVPLALSASLAGLLLVFAFFAVQSGRQRGHGTDLTTMEEALLGRRLGLLEQYRVVERLDLLEEFDVIQDLDRLAVERSG
jgi:hypothetical protein